MMRRKSITILAAIMAWLLVASTALAVVTIEEDAVYANGHAITVVKDEASGETRVTSDDETAGLAGNTTNIAGRDIYGGKKNGDLTGNTSVTIEGGTVGNVYGGGHDTTNDGNTANVTGSTTVVVSGGTVNGNVYGGGHAEGQDGAGSSAAAAQANVSAGADVVISGGTVTGDVYGGGHAEGGNATISKGGGDATADVNGGTDVTLSGGKVDDVYGGGHAEGGDDKGSGPNKKDGGYADADVNGGATLRIGDGSDYDEKTTKGKKEGKNASTQVTGAENIYHFKTGTVTFNYIYNGVTQFTETKTADVYSSGNWVSLSSTWGGNSNVNGGSGTGRVKYSSPTATVNITVTPKTKPGTVTFNYVYNGVIHFTENKTGTVTYGAAPITLSSSWGGNDNVGGGSGSGTVSFAEPTKVVDITVAPNTKTGKVTFNYVYNGVIHFTEDKTDTVTYGAAPITLSSTWGGNDNVGGGSGSGTVSFAEPTKVVDITVAPNTKTGKVTFNYVYNGVIHFTEDKTDTVTYGAAPITLSSTWGGNYNVHGGSGSGEVSFAEPTKEVNITVEPRSATAIVRFIYLYGTTVVSVDEQPVNLTYGDPDKTVTPAPFSVSGYYLLAPVSPVTVNFESTLEQEVAVIEVEVQIGIVDDDDDDDDTQQIPLGPGTPGTVIPLGVGVPSTGDSTGISILLMAIGVTVVAFVAAKARRSSAK